MAQDGDVKWPLVSLTATFLVFAVFSVFFRFWARYTTAATFGVDDWLIIAGLLVSIASGGLNASMLYGDFGSSAIASPATTTVIMKTLIAWEIVYTTAVALIKASILCFYLRLFPSRRFRVTTYVVGSTVAAWWIACVIIAIFQCEPIYKFWTPETPGTCMKMKTVFTINAVPNVVQDLIILIMPVDQIWGLQATRAQKVRLYVTFGIGGFVLIASVYRFRPIMEYNFEGGTKTLAIACSWSVVETAAGVICACLPTLRPLVKLARNKVNMGIKSRSLTKHHPGTEYIAMGDSNHYRADSMAKPSLKQLDAARDASYMYPGEEELGSPSRTGFSSHPAVRPTTSEGPTQFPGKHASDEIIIQTEITVSIANKDSLPQGALRPWEMVVEKPGRAM
ncbi:hypothetical protein N0V93_008159 [Gnomoniopsis smithogilvyi]|uniref:Rhodopsin domain-containing protein n=1 Tax=Gnomoniopsis smithogilvyi TaxID=1191159 RepID=A0A9W8YL65_9PEZI|nr:hypothetical protein N0V93_008159 [Gnomoniopsis smithogilvyi]